MKHWFNKNYKTLIIAAFLIPILTVAIVSISHVTQWYGLSNPVSWAVYLSIGIEIAALSALAAISANMGSKVYFPFAVVTIIQFIGNIFFAYSYIDINGKQFKDWVDLVSPFVEFMGVDPNDFIGHKRFLAFFAGGMLPIISLSFLHMLVKFTEEDRKNEENVGTNETPTKPEDLKNFVDETSRVHLTENDLKILEEALLNPQEPNEELVKAAERYKETIPNSREEYLMKQDPQELSRMREEYWASEGKRKQRDILAEMMKDAQDMGLYDEPSKTPTNAQEMMLTTNEDIINSIPEDDDISDWDVTLMDGLEDEEPFTPSLSEEEINQMNQEEYEKYNSHNITPEFEIPTQDDWTEEELKESVIEPSVTPIEVEKTQIDIQTINETLNQVNEEIDNKPEPTQTIRVVLDENKLKPFDVDLQIERTSTEEDKPSFEVTAEKKNP